MNPFSLVPPFLLAASIASSQEGETGYQWIKVTDKAPFAARDGAGAIALDGKMWLLGGWNPLDKENFPRICNNEVWSSSDGAAWDLVKPNTFSNAAFDGTAHWEGRHAAGWVAYRGKMWIVGGDPNQGHYQNDVWNSADGKAWTLVNKGRPVPWAPRCLHGTVVFRDKMWVLGGQTIPSMAPADEIIYRDVWNTTDGFNWTRVEPQEPYWSAREVYGNVLVFNDRMWILGGATYETPKRPEREFYNDVWSSADGVRWKRHVEHAAWEPRQFHDVAAWDGRMWVLEGWNTQGNRNDVWHSSDGTTWQELPDTPWKTRHAASVFVHADALWMVAGNNMEPDVWRLQRKGGGAGQDIPRSKAPDARPTGKPQRLFEKSSLEVPEKWRIPALPTGKTFHPGVYYESFRATLETRDGPKPFSEAFSFAQDAIVRILYGELRDPAVFKDLLENKRNPIMLFGEGGYLEPDYYTGQPKTEVDAYFDFVVKTKKAFGDRFIALDCGEWTWGGTTGMTPLMKKRCDTLFRIPYPKDRDEGASWWDREWDYIFKRYQDAGIPIFSFNCSTINHYEARKGTSFTGNEIAYGSRGKDGAMIAFCRGAARQFHLPWGMYAAEFPHRTVTQGYHRPDQVRWVEKDVPFGPNCGRPWQERRTLYACYMAGANFVIRESDPACMLSGYDLTAAEKADPQIRAPKDKGKTYAGPCAFQFNELYENIVKRHDRGTPYTPVALMVDRNHGFLLHYSLTHTVGNIPYMPGDAQTRAVINTIFPYESREDAPSPFGEIFDAITTEASKDVIESYRAVVLVGEARVGKELAGTLKGFVEKGGLLFMACERLTPELWGLAGIKDTGQIGQDTGYLRANDFYTHSEVGFKYRKVRLAGAEPLFVAAKAGDRGWPLATTHQAGKGRVLVGTPVWLNVEGNPGRMHGLFSEILGMIADELAPVRVSGGEVKVLFNRNDAGWVVTLMNLEGVTRAFPGSKQAVRDRSAAGVVLEPRFEYSVASEWITGEKFPGTGSVPVVVPPGEIRIIEFRLK